MWYGGVSSWDNYSCIRTNELIMSLWYCVLHGQTKWEEMGSPASDEFFCETHINWIANGMCGCGITYGERFDGKLCSPIGLNKYSYKGVITRLVNGLEEEA